MLNYQRHHANSGSIQSLQGVAINTIITQLGQVAEGIYSRFSCGGKYEVPSNKPIKLVYCQAAGNLAALEKWSSVKFPGVLEGDMIKLLEACSVASCGYTEGKDVVDKYYRNAFKLEADNFTTSFQVSSIPILQEIQSIVPTVMGLKAELYKLNIYARGGFFKAHVDTPRSDKNFGSLVVCLPTQFTGGELVVRHHKQEIKYDWSSSGSDTSSALHWAAFFSDVEHEVLPVSEGYRVTLTYNLSYHSKEGGSTFDVKINSFYNQLQAVLSNPVFMRDGGVLGFNSHYSYVFDTQWADLLAPINTIEDKADTIKQLNSRISCDKFSHLSKDEQEEVLRGAGIGGIYYKQILDALPSDFPLLKGGDYVVVESAKLLGLPVCVKTFLSDDDTCDSDEDSNYKYALKDFSLRFKENEGISGIKESRIHQLAHLEVFGDAVCRYKAQDITWCQELSYHQPAGAAAAYNVDYSARLKVWYKSAAILIRIPRWSNYREKLISGEHYIKGEPSVTGEDRMVKDFKDIIHNYAEIIQEESQPLLNQVEKLLGNKYIKKSQGMVDLLKEMKRRLDSSTMNVKEQVDSLCHIKCDLHQIRKIVESQSRTKAEQLQEYLVKVRWFYRRSSGAVRNANEIQDGAIPEEFESSSGDSD